MNQTVLRAESAVEIPETSILQWYQEQELAAGWWGWASYERQG